MLYVQTTRIYIWFGGGLVAFTELNGSVDMRRKHNAINCGYFSVFFFFVKQHMVLFIIKSSLNG